MGGRKPLKEKLKSFRQKAGKDIMIERMILFGSRAEGKAKKDSDIDLLIVSPQFRKLDFFKRGAKMYDYWDLKYPVDFLCYTPEEFKELSKQITLVAEAVKNGIEL